MKREFHNARTRGKIIKMNNFDTTRGKYTIILRAYKGDIYFFKYRDKQLLECCNLTEKGRNKEDNQNVTRGI